MLLLLFPAIYLFKWSFNFKYSFKYRVLLSDLKYFIVMSIIIVIVSIFTAKNLYKQNSFLGIPIFLSLNLGYVLLLENTFSHSYYLSDFNLFQKVKKLLIIKKYFLDIIYSIFIVYLILKEVL